jgi:hypothetical protein
MVLPPTSPSGGDANAYAISPSELADGTRMPKRGELGIKERRSWHSWQLLLAAIVALVIGMGLDEWAGLATSSGASSGGTSSTGGQYTLPPASGSSTSATTTTTTTAQGSGSQSTVTTTSVSSGATTTTTVAASGSSTTSTSTVTTGPAQLLLGPTQKSGNWTSPSFSVNNPGWNIGWAFQCTPVPTAGTSFVVYVTPAGAATSGSPAISETGGSGQSVTSQSTVGQQQLVIQAPANCEWVVKVTGS